MERLFQFKVDFNVTAIAIHHDNIFIAGGAPYIDVLKTNGDRISRLDGHTGWVTALLMLQGSTLASADANGSLRTWDCDTLKAVREWKGHDKMVSCLAYDGKALYSGSRDRTIGMWDPATGRLIQKLEGHNQWILCLYCVRGGYLASGDAIGGIRFWSKDEPKVCVSEWKAHDDRVHALAYCGKWLYSGGRDRKLAIWDMNAGKCRQKIDVGGSILAFQNIAPNLLAIAFGEGSLRLVNTETDEFQPEVKAHTDKVLALCTNGKGVLISGSEDHTVGLWCTGKSNAAVQKDSLNWRQIVEKENTEKDELIKRLVRQLEQQQNEIKMLREIASAPPNLNEVLVVGMGPVGLIMSSILALNGVKVTCLERRIDELNGRWNFQNQYRRPQVVTLQCNIMQHLPPVVRQALLQRAQTVWPASQNIRIRDVEDNLLNFIQTNDDVKKNITIVKSSFQQTNADGLDSIDAVNRLAKKFFKWVTTTFPHRVIIDTEGSQSVIQRHCEHNLGLTKSNTYGTDYALGVEVNSIVDIDEPGTRLDHAIVATILQMRYLFNGKCSDNLQSLEGYINIRLSKEEYDAIIRSNDANRMCRLSSPCWIHSISNPCNNNPGIQIKEENQKLIHTLTNAFNFFQIPLANMGSITMFELSPKNMTNAAMRVKDRFVFLCGDSCISHHFWPGRGLNTGMATAIMLGRHFKGGQLDTSTDFAEFKEFLKRVREEEHIGYQRDGQTWGARQIRFLPQQILKTPIINTAESDIQFFEMCNYTKEDIEQYNRTRNKDINQMRQKFREKMMLSYDRMIESAKRRDDEPTAKRLADAKDNALGRQYARFENCDLWSLCFLDNREWPNMNRVVDIATLM